MGSRRRRLDPVGPFGNPDGSRADIEDLISEFVDFGGDPAYGHLATRANDSMVRVIVGKLGAGKTVYLRRLQDFQSRQDSVYADVPQQSLPKTEVVVKACQWFSDQVLVEKWMQIWDRAIMRSLTSHVLSRPELRQQLRDEQIDEIEGSYARLLDDFRRPRTIYSQVRDIINQRQTAHQLSTYLDDPLWDDLEDLLGEVVGRCKPIYFYLDALDEEFSHAPMYWLKCQEGLFYQVMRLLRDHRLGGRLHIVVCIRDIVMSSVYRSEHAPRYYNEPHIRVLTWDRSSLLYLLQRKLQRLPPSLLMRRAATGPPTIGDWLGVNGHWLGPDGDGPIGDYLLSHTRLIPRDIISLGNDLNEEVLRQKQAGHEGLPPTALQRVVQRCAKRFGDSQLAQCANQISSDLMPANAALHDYSELFTSTQAYISGVQEDVRSFVRLIGVDRFSRADLEALQEVADLHFEKATDLASVLWQNGLLGYVDESGRRRFYSMGDVEEFHFPPDVGTYVLHPCLVYTVGGIRHVPADSVSAGAGDPRRTMPFTSAERVDLPGAPSAAPSSSGSRALPEPDPAEVRSSAGGKAADYAVGDVIEDRFEILDVVGQGGFSKVYRVRDDVEGEERALKLFDSAAGYQAVRREIGALRKIHHPHVVQVFWARQDQGRRLVSHHRVHRRGATQRVRQRNQAPSRPGSSRCRPRPARRARRISSRFGAPAAAGGPAPRRGTAGSRVARVAGTAGQGAGTPRYQAAQRDPHSHRSQTARLQHRLPGRRPGAHALRHAPVPATRRRPGPLGRLHRPVRRRRAALPAPLQRSPPVPQRHAHDRRTGDRPENDPP